MEKKEIWILSSLFEGTCWSVGKTRFLKFTEEEVDGINFGPNLQYEPNLWYEFKKENVSLHESKSAAVVGFVVAHPIEDLFELVESYGTVIVSRSHDGNPYRFSEGYTDERMSKRYKKVESA